MQKRDFCKSNLTFKWDFIALLGRIRIKVFKHQSNMPILKPFLKLSKLFSLFILALSLLLLGCQSANHIEQSQGFNVEKILNKALVQSLLELEEMNSK